MNRPLLFSPRWRWSRHSTRMLIIAILLCVVVPTSSFAQANNSSMATPTIHLPVTTGSLLPSGLGSRQWTASIEWNTNNGRANIEFLPLTSYKAVLRFVPRRGFSLTGVDFLQFKIPGAKEISLDPTQPNTLIATFPETTGVKPFRVITDSSGKSSIITASLIERTATTEQWLDDRLSSYQPLFSTHMKSFETTVLPIIRERFLDFPDVDANGTVDVLVSQLPQNTLGYVNYEDQSKTPYVIGWNRPNFGETVYIDDDVLAKSSETFFHRVLIHELQHVSNRRWSETWLNEGLSEAAAHEYYVRQGIAGLQENITHFNNRRDRFVRPVTQWVGDKLSYAKSYLFVQYIRTQAERVQGREGAKNIFRDLIVADQTRSSRDAVQWIAHQYIQPGITFNQLVRNFEEALKRKSSTGEFGFNGEPFFQQLR